MRSLLALIAAVAVAECLLVRDRPTGGCERDSDCGTSQCCIPNDRFMVASKRDMPPGGPGLFPIIASGGVCRNYVKEGSSCHYLGFTSCGCEPGTKCNYYPSGEADSLFGKRVMIYRPGDSFCEKQ